MTFLKRSWQRRMSLRRHSRFVQRRCWWQPCLYRHHPQAGIAECLLVIVPKGRAVLLLPQSECPLLLLQPALWAGYPGVSRGALLLRAFVEQLNHALVVV